MVLEFAKALTSQIKNPTLNKAANTSLNALGRVSSAYGSLKNMATGAKNAYTSAPAPVKTAVLSTILPLPAAASIASISTKKEPTTQSSGFTPASQSMLDALKRQQSTTPIKQPFVQQPTITSNGQQGNPYYFDNTSSSPSVPTTNIEPTTPVSTKTQVKNVTPEMKSFLAQRQALMGQISSAMLPTEEELATSKKLQELQAQQANIAASEQLGLNKIEDQPIAMNFITGQQAALQRQAAAQSGALQAQQIPLQTQLAMIQAERQRKADIAKVQLESDTPIEVGGSLVNPVTGEVVYSGAKNAEGFTLGEGQARYDAQGNLLASVPKSEAALTPYQAAQLEIERQKIAQGKQLTPDQINRISEGKQLPIVLEGLEKAIKENSMVFGPVAGRIAGANPYAAQTQTIQAELKRAMQSIGKYLEGGVLRAEDEKKYEKMLPQLTDTPQVALNKLAGIKTLLENKQAQYLSDIGSGGYNQSNFGSQTSAGASTGFNW